MIVVIKEWLRRQICLTLTETLLPTQREFVLPCLVNFPCLYTDIMRRCLHELE